MSRRSAIVALCAGAVTLGSVGVAQGFVPFRSRWSGATAEMRINASSFPPGSARLAEVEDQLEAWNEVDGCEFLFTQRVVNQGDSAFNHGDAISGVAFSNRMQRNVLGVAFSNDRGRRRFASDVNFNASLNWVFGRAPRSFREYHFGSTCAHEFGHALGLQHSDRGCRALMGGGCGSPGRVRPFTADDISGAQFLYPGASRAPAGGSQPAGEPDWELDGIQVTPSDPAPGDTLEVTVTGVQGGTADASRIPAVWIVLSTNQTISTQDAVLDRVAAQPNASFAAGQRFTLTRQVTLPVAASGERFLGVLIDPEGDVREASEDNNTRAALLRIQAPPAPDQDWAVQVVLTPERLPEGDTVELSYRLTNLGAPGNAVPEVRLFLSTNDTISTRDTLLETIPGGVGVPLEGRRSFQASLAPGEYFLGAIVDPSDQLGELREDNNSGVARLVVEPAQQTAPPSGGSTAGTPSGGSTAGTPSGGSTAGTPSGGSTAGTPSGGSTAGATAGTPSGGSTAGATAGTPSGGSAAGATAGTPSGGSTAGSTASASTASASTAVAATTSPNALPPGGGSGSSGGCSLVAAGPGGGGAEALVWLGLLALAVRMRRSH